MTDNTTTQQSVSPHYPPQSPVTRASPLNLDQVTDIPPSPPFVVTLKRLSTSSDTKVSIDISDGSAIFAVCPECHVLKSCFRCISCIETAAFSEHENLAKKHLIVEERSKEVMAPYFLAQKQARARKRAQQRLELIRMKIGLEMERIDMLKSDLESERKHINDRMRYIETAAAELAKNKRERMALMNPLLSSLKLTAEDISKDIILARKSVLSELMSLFPLNPASETESVIVNIVVPNDVNFYNDIRPPALIGTACGYIIHLMRLISEYSVAYLPFPVVFKGSESMVLHRSLPDNPYLCIPGTDFKMGLNLLCIDCMVLAEQFGVRIPDNRVKELVVNLQRLIKARHLDPHSSVNRRTNSESNEDDGWDIVEIPPPPPPEFEGDVDLWSREFGESGVDEIVDELDGLELIEDRY